MIVKLNIKKGDKVLVLAGKDKGSKGTVLSALPKENKVLVENVNVATKHKKPRSAQDKGGIVKKSLPIDASNVMIICAACGKATRVAHKTVGDKKVRICKKCNAVLDKKFVKDVKKAEKKTAKAVEKAKNEEKKVAEKKTVETPDSTIKTPAKTTAKAPAKTTAKAPVKTTTKTSEKAKSSTTKAKVTTKKADEVTSVD